jgi:putative aldouronate transport system substrate-binding protein
VNAPQKGQQNTPNIINGKLYALTACKDGYNYNLLWIRKDWLDKVNMPVPKTLDDLKAVATAFVQNKLGGDKTVGLILAPQYPLWNSDMFDSASPIANAVGAYPGSWIKGPDGKIIYGTVAPEMKTALGIMADWYKAGLIDPQFMTYKNVDEADAFVTGGQCGMWFVAWWAGYGTAPMEAKDPKEDWIPVLCPLDANGKYTHTNPMFGSGGGIVVNVKFAHPEAVVKAMNVEYEAVSGMYDSDPEIYAMLKPSRDAGAGGRTIDPFSGSIANNFFKNPEFGTTIDNYIKTGSVTYPADFTPADKEQVENAMTYSKNQDKTDQKTRLSYSSYYQACMLLNDPANVDVTMYSFTTESMADLWPNLQKLESEMIVQIISGQKPLDYFDDFVTQWKQSGGDQITSEVQALVGQ